MKNSILLFIVSLILASCSSKGSQPETQTLKDAYKDAFLVGAAVNNNIVSGRDAEAQQIVLNQFNTTTPENVMKPGPINPEPGDYNFGPADAYVEFANEHDMFTVGHTLVWHNQTPDWFFKDENGDSLSPEAQIDRMRNHIEKVAGRYAGKVDGWDVVNEVIGDNGSYRPTPWVKNVGNGDTLVKKAFRFAHRYAPDAELYYNDFDTWKPKKRDGIVHMVRMLQDVGIKIDGVGMQAHWGLDYPKAEYIRAAIDSFATLGVKVMITELDVDVLPKSKDEQIVGDSLQKPEYAQADSLNPYPNGLPEKVQQQLTERYAELFRIFYENRDKIARVTLWGVDDGMSWKNNYPIPGRTNYPLLFNRDKKPKPAFDAVLKVPQHQ